MVESAMRNVDWEAMWSPYDEAIYQTVLDHINHDDIVLDIGAGDLRLACRMAEKCVRVYAIEIQEVFKNSLDKDKENSLPENLLVTYNDARSTPFPDDVSTGIILMRHCTNLRLYADKLKGAGAKRLITNARWRLGVEIVPLQTTRFEYQQMSIGWYACWCGATGFRSGPVELLTPELESITTEVINCPDCEILCESLEI